MTRTWIRFLPVPLMLALGILSACEHDTPGEPEPPRPSVSSLAFRPGAPPFPAPAVASRWRLVSPTNAFGAREVRLQTSQGPAEFRWSWDPPLDLPDTVLWRLEPVAGGEFHAQLIPPGALPGPPLPIQAVESTAYPHLLALLQELSEPWFGQVVVHWPAGPVPVRCGEAVAGLVDLSACLAEAVAIWNADPGGPWFRVDEAAAWGVRLVHLPDRRLSPPLSIHITRLDSTRAPLRMNLLAGNNYDALREPRYVVRGFVHELGHALLLWGHTRDRIHCLWGAAPPIVDQPSCDERKAARLWHGLPVGLDLSRYE